MYTIWIEQPPNRDELRGPLLRSMTPGSHGHDMGHPPITHRLRVWYIHLHLGDFLGPMLANNPYMDQLTGVREEIQDNPMVFMGKSIVSCRFSLESTH